MRAPLQFVDVDGHILEPPDLWENYLEPEYRSRAIRISRDEKGMEYLNVEGQKSWFFQGGNLGAITGIGQDVRKFFEGTATYADGLVPGGYDPHERIKVMNTEGIDISIVYPSLGLAWEGDCRDPQLAAAYCRAYNNWLFDFCRPYHERLIAAAHIPILDVREGVQELRRTAQLGAKVAMIGSTVPNGLPLGSSYFDPLWAAAQELDMPISIHPTSGPISLVNFYYPKREDMRTWWAFVVAGDEVKFQFTTFFNEGTFEKFPRLKIVILESGIAWLAPWIQRMDDKYKVNGFTTPMKKMPGEYFQDHCWIAMDPDDASAAPTIKAVGADKLLWAYDFPHSDSIVAPVRKLKQNLARLTRETQRKIYGENAIKLYKLPALVPA